MLKFLKFCTKSKLNTIYGIEREPYIILSRYTDKRTFKSSIILYRSKIPNIVFVPTLPEANSMADSLAKLGVDKAEMFYACR